MGTVWHAGLPWQRLKAWYRRGRSHIFRAPRPRGRYVRVPLGVGPNLREVFGRRYYAPNWETSYYKRGEVLNLARVEYDPREVDGTEYRWWQTHVRGWLHSDSMWLSAHYELEPTEHPNAHILGVGHDPRVGRERIKQTLDDAGIEYGTAHYPTDEPPNEG